MANMRRYNLLYAGAAMLARSMDVDEVFGRLESDLHFQVAVRARRTLFVRAGVVGWHGGAIVILGPPFGGTSALLVALLGAGATYYSDRYAVFDTRGRVHPYPTALSFRDAAGTRSRPRPAADLGASSGIKPLPVALIVVTAYQPRTHWRPRELLPAETVLALLEHTVVARIRPDFALDVLRQVIPSAMALRGKRGEASVTARELLDYCENRRTTRSRDSHRLGRSHIDVTPDTT